MSDEERIQRVIDQLEAFGGVAEDLAASINENAKDMSAAKKSTKQRKTETADSFSALNDALNDTTSAYDDVADQHKKNKDRVTKSFNEIANTLDADMGDALSQAGKEIYGLASAAASAAKSFVTATSDNLGAFSVLRNMLQNSITALGNFAGDIIGGVSKAFSGILGKIPLVGSALESMTSVLGKTISGLTKFAGKIIGQLAGTAIELLVDSLDKAMNMFKETTNVGLFFKDGLVGLTNQMTDLSL